MGFRQFTLADEPSQLDDVAGFVARYWPRFLMENESSVGAAERLPSDFARYQLVVDDGSDEWAAVALTIPVSVDDDKWFSGVDGWDAAVSQGCEDVDLGRPIRCLVGLSATVRPDLRTSGVGQMVIRAMKELARQQELQALWLPVRPAGKHRYPLLSMEDYLAMRRPDGSRYDPWVRSHEQLGGQVKHVAAESMVVVEPLADWTEWTGLEFPVSGSYIVANGLVPIEADVHTGLGTYAEPNVWVRHDL